MKYDYNLQPEFPRFMRLPDEQAASSEGTINGLVELYRETQPSHLVEIGCWTGESSEIACQFCDILICIDPWEPPDSDPNEIVFLQRMAKYKNVLRIKQFSHIAASLFSDRSLDQVYIDGMHDEGNVARDIRVWLPKIKIGGYITGHDYDNNPLHSGVIRSVHNLLGKPEKVYSDCSWLFKVTHETVLKSGN